MLYVLRDVVVAPLPLPQPILSSARQNAHRGEKLTENMSKSIELPATTYSANFNFLSKLYTSLIVVFLNVP